LFDSRNTLVLEILERRVGTQAAIFAVQVAVEMRPLIDVLTGTS